MTSWPPPPPSPTGPVRCRRCPLPALLTEHGYACACGAQEHHAAAYAPVRVGVGVLLLQGDRLLVGRRVGPEGGGWCSPAGRLERGERPVDCAARELAEETGITGVELRMLDVWTHDGGHETWPDFVTLWAWGRAGPGVEAELREPEKCAEWRWCRERDMPEPLFRCMASLRATGIDPWRLG